MRNISSALKQEMIDGNRAVLVRVICQDGTVYGYTDHDLQLTVDGIVHSPAPGLKRIMLQSTVDDKVSNQEYGSAWVDAPEDMMLGGKFDNAWVETRFCSYANTALGSFMIDKGNLGNLTWTADGFMGDVQSHMRRLQRNISFVYTAGCRHQLFSQFDNKHIGACTLNSASFTFTGTVSAINTQNISFNVTGLSQPDQYCSNGVLTFTSGQNNGLKFQVKKHTVGVNTTIDLYLPTNYPITVADTFSITAGCDKTFATCKAKFSNAINFGGFPNIQVTS